ncbi:Vi polysaccharide biosynthesis protein VipA/TviB [Halobacteriovorax marinus]|uniref:Vi polysaccharide biosynthesis protein VipA/TviB n=1 Tax=Halobacteriovorax marinus TaxID=97084 RepID=A0A1Y5FAV7_9BACT|nr:Vi polysaccharide biosynthesis protein VipA/TviB [Halobacteriovorax marinus]
MTKIAIIGLGYVGLPLAIEFSKKFETYGFDIYEKRINQLKDGLDSTFEIDEETLKSTELTLSNSPQDIKDCNIYIVTVPTPIDDFKKPDLSPLISATKLVGGLLKKGDIVIYESTVYPGCTEEDCVPVLELESGLEFNKDFSCGYSPERMNPGDKEHTVTKIIKVTSGSNEETAQKVDKLYKSIVTAGTHLASSIRVAEASKIIENTQRDINIAFINELAMIFNKMEIDTLEVLEAAATKWNFLHFKPGLVGGHCIGVDPYYLTQKAESIGLHPEMILSGRRINDSMGSYIAQQAVKKMLKKGLPVSGAKIVIMGVTFKENCPDIRNSKVIDIIAELQEFNCNVTICDPWVSEKIVSSKIKNVNYLKIDELSDFDAVIFAVGHKEFLSLDPKKLTNSSGIVYDVKGIFPREMSDIRL